MILTIEISCVDMRIDYLDQ